MKSVSEGLTEARAHIANGWGRGRLSDGGRVCARGALNWAFLGDPDTFEEWRPDDQLRLAQHLVAEAMHGRYVDGFNDGDVRTLLYRWNDTRPSNGKAEVLRAFDKAIVEAVKLEAEFEAAKTFKPFEVQIWLSEEVLVDPVFDEQIKEETKELAHA